MSIEYKGSARNLASPMQGEITLTRNQTHFNQLTFSLFHRK